MGTQTTVPSTPTAPPQRVPSEMKLALLNPAATLTACVMQHVGATLNVDATTLEQAVKDMNSMAALEFAIFYDFLERLSLDTSVYNDPAASGAPTLSGQVGGAAANAVAQLTAELAKGSTSPLYTALQKVVAGMQVAGTVIGGVAGGPAGAAAGGAIGSALPISGS